MSFSLGALLSFKTCLHRVHGPCMVFTGIFKLFFFLSNFTVNLLFGLAKLKLGTENLIFLCFQSTFSLFQSSLKFFLFYFKTTTLLVQLMDGSSSISQLIKEVLEVISLAFPFSHNLIKVVSTLLSNDCSSMGTLIFHGKLFQFRLNAMLGFFS